LRPSKLRRTNINKMTVRRCVKLNNGKKVLYSSITLITLIITQIVLRSIGIDNISAQAFVGLLIIACLLVIYGTFKDGKKGAGIRYNVTVAILLVLTCISTSVSMIMSKFNPDLLDKYSLVFLPVQLITFFALCLYIIIYRIIYETKRHK
jgi:hypothetical protein